MCAFETIRSSRRCLDGGVHKSVLNSAAVPFAVSVEIRYSKTCACVHMISIKFIELSLSVSLYLCYRARANKAQFVHLRTRTPRCMRLGCMHGLYGHTHSYTTTFDKALRRHRRDTCRPPPLTVHGHNHL